MFDLSLHHAVLIPLMKLSVAGPTCGNMAKDICVSDRSHVPKSSVFSDFTRWCCRLQNNEKSSMPTNPGNKQNGKWFGKKTLCNEQVAVVTASVAFSGKNKKTSENNWEGSLPMNQVLDYWKTAISSAFSFDECHYDMKHTMVCMLSVDSTRYAITFQSNYSNYTETCQWKVPRESSSCTFLLKMRCFLKGHFFPTLPDFSRAFTGSFSKLVQLSICKVRKLMFQGHNGGRKREDQENKGHNEQGDLSR